MDYIIRNALIIDGTGQEPFKSDISIKGDKIVSISEHIVDSTSQEIEAAGFCVSPGFIDSHAHDDYALINDPTILCKLSQGVTSVVIGNCGISMAPLLRSPIKYKPFDLLAKKDNNFFKSMSDYIGYLEKNPPSVNYLPLIGNAALRVSVQDNPGNIPNASEIKDMVDLLDKNLAQGARGLSLGIEYPLGSNISVNEIVPLLECVKKYNGVLAMHIRTEGNGIIDAIKEAVDLNPFKDLPLIISHHKCAGVKNFNNSIKTLAMIEAEAKQRNIKIDAYPYTYASTVLLPGFVKLSSKTIISYSEPYPEYVGKELSDICTLMNCNEEEAIQKLSPAKALYHVMSDDDVNRILSHPLCMLGSDGLHDENPHPRLWGSFSRFLGHYVRDNNLLPLQEAVRKITSLPAQTYGLKDRGILKSGAFADIVIFNKDTIKDTAVFGNLTPSQGIKAVFVNGKLTFNNGLYTGISAGIKL